MAEEKPAEVPSGATAAAGDDEDDELTPGYKAPAQVDLKTIQDMDADDESLVKYKQQLLGATSNVLDEGGNNVVVKQMIVAPDGREPFVFDLTGDVKALKDKPIVIKEGAPYKIKIVFRVQREIVSGLRYFQASYRKGIRVDKSNLMIGSYGPKTENHEYSTPVEEAPSGLVSRGHYTIKSKFTDDDKTSILEWEWSLDIKKEWA